MKCEEYDDRLIELALGTLPQDELEMLRAHLASGCPRCAGRLAELQATLTMLPLALPMTEAPGGIRERLLARVRESAGARKVGTVAPVRSTWWIGALIGGAIAAAVLIVVGGAWMREARSVAQLTAQLDQRDQQLSDLRIALATEQQTARAIRSPSALMVSLEGAALPSAQGRVFMDPQLGKWWFAARGLKRSPRTRPTNSG